MSVYFVYRSHYEGPSGKHVRRLDGDSVLGWFQAVWERAKQAEDVSEWVNPSSVPTSTASLRSSRPHGTNPCRRPESIGSSSVPGRAPLRRGRDPLRTARPPGAHRRRRDRAGLLLLRRPLPQGASGTGGVPAPRGLAAARRRAATTLRARRSSPRRSIPPVRAGDDLPGVPRLLRLDLTDLDLEGPWRIDGVRVPDLADYLRDATPDEEWPFELKLLRSQLPPDDSGEDGLRCGDGASRPPPGPPDRRDDCDLDVGLGTVEQAAAELEGILTKLPSKKHGFDPSKSLVARATTSPSFASTPGLGGRDVPPVDPLR